LKNIFGVKVVLVFDNLFFVILILSSG